MLTTFDIWLADHLQSWQPEWLTVTMKLVTTLFGPAVIIVLSLIVVGWLWFRQQKNEALLLLLISAGHLFTPVLKYLFGRPRPTYDQVQIFISQPGNGLPSGHALGIVLFAALLWIAWPSFFARRRPVWLSWKLAFLIMVVGYSRIYLGVHWPSDIFLGYIVGGAWVIVCVGYGRTIIQRLFLLEPVKKSPPPRRSRKKKK